MGGGNPILYARDHFSCEKNSTAVHPKQIGRSAYIGSAIPHLHPQPHRSSPESLHFLRHASKSHSASRHPGTAVPRAAGPSSKPIARNLRKPAIRSNSPAILHLDQLLDLDQPFDRRLAAGRSNRRPHAQLRSCHRPRLLHRDRPRRPHRKPRRYRNDRRGSLALPECCHLRRRDLHAAHRRPRRL
jgi:hypothetical protein